MAYFDIASAEDTRGKVAPLNETGYITVSTDVMDVLPRINNPPPPYHANLSDKVVLDLWKVDPSDYSIFLANLVVTISVLGLIGWLVWRKRAANR